mmetsp:Transcript_40967/g.122310  ORF Transcript_40967/g.122310 Transcript_40967/m.122310 type:complete len:101 (+) Transcript_40967:753-1055(+)
MERQRPPTAELLRDAWDVAVRIPAGPPGLGAVPATPSQPRCRSAEGNSGRAASRGSGGGTCGSSPLAPAAMGAAVQPHTLLASPLHSRLGDNEYRTRACF